MNTIDPVLLLTVTGDRKYTFNLVMYWISKQVGVKGQWLIIDDSSEHYNLPNEIGNWEVIHHREESCPKEKWGIASQVNLYQRSLDIMKRHLNAEVVIMIGDDDYYKETYVKDILKRIDGYQVAGSIKAICIHPFHGAWKLGNKTHAAMESTAIKMGPALDLFEEANNDMGKEIERLYYVDKRFYDKVLDHNMKVNLFEYEIDSKYLMYNLKGHTYGRPGISEAHRVIDHYKKCVLQKYIPPDDLELIRAVWGK